MIIENYLRDVQAERDVAAALERHRAGTANPGCDRWTIAHGVISDSSNPWLMAFCMGAGEEATDQDGDPIYRKLPNEPMVAYPTHEALKVYFRPQGDRYIVTDLGEAVRALRLRGVAFYFDSPLESEPLPVPAGVLLVEGMLVDDRPRAADLPRAIVRMMFSAWRIGGVALRVSAEPAPPAPPPAPPPAAEAPAGE